MGPAEKVQGLGNRSRHWRSIGGGSKLLILLALLVLGVLLTDTVLGSTISRLDQPSGDRHLQAAARFSEPRATHGADVGWEEVDEGFGTVSGFQLFQAPEDPQIPQAYSAM
ncbi:unnamed protein product, partial [Chrysoparadoxa australica]